MNTLLLACSATKRPDAGALPALDRYDGPMYRVLRRALRERPGLRANLTIVILSAEFGIITAETPIPDYDRRMTRARAAELASGVTLALADQWPPNYVEVGHVYRAALPSPPWPVSIRVGHGGIGERLHQLKEWLYGIELPD